ncbi:hypothetical protein ABZ622_37525 [Streptomyces sp. NPDC007164]|uniref:hypothetical protein n=1 Tax=Streptomyces sp. NPDC007164 TaxID=3156918 RepID=UPI0033E0EE84
MRRTDPRPPEAWWSKEDREWVLGSRDEHGRLVGVVRYWDADGRFICESEHAAGRPHGISRRYDHPGGELSQECRYADGRIDGVRHLHRPANGSGAPWRDTEASVRVYEYVYEDGDLIGTRALDDSGVEVDHRTGRPVPQRPDGVAPTARHLPGAELPWLFLRRRGEDGDKIIEIRKWWPDGTLCTERLLDGTDRRRYRSGVLWWEGRRVRRDGILPMHGVWRYHDADGLLRRESVYDSAVGHGAERYRTWHRTAEEADGCGVTRSGPVEDGVEVGLWQIRDASGALLREIRLGRRWTDAALLASPAAGESPCSAARLWAVLADADADDPDGAAAHLAWIRLAAREGIDALTPLVEDECPWPAVAADAGYKYDGVPASPLTPQSSLAEVIHALRWGEPAGPTLARLARDLFHHGHPHTALDVIDAALLLGDDADWHRTRAVLLRALGRDTEADAVTPGPDHADQAATRLLLTIRERPADNTPRLAYAKLVAASHPEHARLITAQCGGDAADDKDAAMAAYLATLPAEVRDALIGRPERGFVRTVTDVGAETFLHHHDALFRAAPEDDCLVLQFANDHLAEISLLPALGRYRSLRVYDTYLFDDTPAQLARSPYLRQLESLSLRDTYLSDEDLAALLTSRSYPRLRELDVSASRYDEQNWTTAGLMPLRDAVFAPHLEFLNLGRSSYDLDNGVASVLTALPNLTFLKLGGNPLGDEVLTRLSTLPNRFTELDLTGDAFTPEGITALVNSPAVARLQRLTMTTDSSGIGAAMAALVRGRQLGALRTLRLSGGYLNKPRPWAGMGHAFARSAFTNSLEELTVSWGCLGPEGAAGLAAAPFRRLRYLDLYDNRLGDDGAVALARTPALATLRSLNLSYNQIGNVGALVLAESPHLTGIEWLDLRDNQFGDRAACALHERFGSALRS